MSINFKSIYKKAEEYKPNIISFLRDMIAIPSESCQEERIIKRIKQEMIKVGFDKVNIDQMGNVLGYIGTGKHLIAFDAHVDTVGIGSIKSWNYDPYKGKEEGDVIIGRGASDQKGGIASMVYAGKIIKDLNLAKAATVIMVGTVQEEDCDGLCWQYIIEKSKIKPEFVVSTEPTSLRIHRGQRGRMEIQVTTHGISCHGSAPERGDNAIYKMGPIINELKALNQNLQFDEFLGKGTLTISEIFFSSPSRCAVADECSISIDRRLTNGETSQSAIEEIKNLPAVRAANAEVKLYKYAKPSYTGLVYSTECFFPTWVLPADHPICRSTISAYKNLFNQDPVVDKWTFSTNGVSIMGRYGIPVVGFGPGHEDQAHAPNERTWKSELVKSAAMYATIPQVYTENIGFCNHDSSN